MELDPAWTWIFYHTCRLMAHWKALWSEWDVKVWLTMARLNYGITHKNNGDVEIKAWLQSKVLVCVKNSRPSFAAAEKASCPKNLPGRRQMLRVFSLKWYLCKLSHYVQLDALSHWVHLCIFVKTSMCSCAHCHAVCVFPAMCTVHLLTLSPADDVVFIFCHPCTPPVAGSLSTYHYIYWFPKPNFQRHKRLQRNLS